ncbi:parallel beta-helix repeat protein [Sphingomonas naasensis]|uniref:right-handed parallel beta-helix repeat-containing protein n=1 Tax=Sphingomonas naasensis TaxID=1344951 RepID=UPI001F0D7030|nr:right-handed parallel beta-helix repeat-containing protein [Sphingomonas naasensis]NIJ18479.1 parallel beta-helix repeat protein [Sphingomonas naasensis]
MKEGGETRVYLLVLRTINGVERRFLERLSSATWDQVEDSCYLDCAVTFRPESPTSQFGATGDGTTVDTQAINRAIAACSSGDTLYFPPGIYLVDNSEIIVSSHGDTSLRPLPDGVNIFMEGGAWAKRAPAANDVIFFTCDGNNTLQVNVDGDEFPGSMTGAWPAGSSTFGVFARTADGVRVVQSRFKNIKGYGIQMRGGSRWVVSGCDFYRIGLSGALFQNLAPVRHCIVSNCTFEDMGDTAAAFSPMADETSDISLNIITGCTARNTNYRTAGFAFDFEGGYYTGTYHHNLIIGCTVEQTQGDAVAQGGVTINLLNESSAIIGCVCKGRTTGALTSDVGISVPGTTGILVEGNLVENFRGGGVYADGAATPTINANRIKNCGEGSSPLYSTILLAYLFGSTGAVVTGNSIECDTAYTYGGNGGAAIFARRFNANNVTDLVIQSNRIRNPIGFGIEVFGFSGGSSYTGRVTIKNNVIAGDGSSTVFLNNPIFANYVVGLCIKDNEVHETKYGFDLTGSTNIQVVGNTIENLTTSPTIAAGINLTSTDKATVEKNKLNATFTSKLVTTSATNLVVGENSGIALTNAVDDAAAAAAGVTIGSKYRNGSVIMQRIA